MKLDPCDFILKEGADAFRRLIEAAVDPLAYLLGRAAARFDLDSIEGSRRAAEWVVGILSRVPQNGRSDFEFKKAKVLDSLSFRLHVPLATLTSMLRQSRRPGPAPRRNPAGDNASSNGSPVGSEQAVPNNQPLAAASAAPIRQSDLDQNDLELIRIIVNEPAAIARLIPRLLSTRYETLRCGPFCRPVTTSKARAKYQVTKIS